MPKNENLASFHIMLLVVRRGPQCLLCHSFCCEKGSAGMVGKKDFQNETKLIILSEIISVHTNKTENVSLACCVSL